MLQTSLNIFDLGVLIILGLSALLSFYRGIAREIISLGSWIGATIITLYAFPQVSKWIEPQVKSPMIASGLASLGIFIIALITITIITGILIKFIKPSKEIGFIDNMLGLLFGIARGILLVSIGYFIMTLVVAPRDYPEWVKDAATRPYVEKSARYIAKLTPTYIEDAVIKNKDALPKKKDLKADLPDIDADDFDTKPKVTKGTSSDDDTDTSSFKELQRRINAAGEK